METQTQTQASPGRPALQGGLLALLAALLFGASTPLVQLFGAGVGSFTTAALLYAGAALVGALLRAPVQREARVMARDARTLALMALFGAVMGPVALAWGLQRTSGAGASLMLTLEAVFTAALARLWYHEALDRRVLAALALLTAGGMALVLNNANSGSTPSLLGLLAVLLATAAWGVDNTLSRAVATRDPGQVVMFKGALGAAATTGLAALFAEPLPAPGPALALLAVGATGYGLSLRFYLLAQRAFGAARTGSVFAFAPFVGAALAWTWGPRTDSMWLWAGAALMLAGIVLHLAERHTHTHTHEALEHEHAHSHDDGHHNHMHVGHDGHNGHPVMHNGLHSHLHRHAPLQHTHAHMPDEHHTHRH